MVKVRQLPVDEHFSLRGDTLDRCIKEDKQKGLLPFFVSVHGSLVVDITRLSF